MPIVRPRPPIPVPQPVNLGFVPPRCNLQIPPNLGRPPTLADVTVVQGFDGKTPAQAAQAVLASSTTPIAAQNTDLTSRTAMDVDKAFTVAVNNGFIASSPLAQLAAQNPGATVSVLGTLSEVHPSMVRLTLPGQSPRFFEPDGAGGFTAVPRNPYRVVMQADLRLGPNPGVRISYPKWSVPALAGQLGKVTEEP